MTYEEINDNLGRSVLNFANIYNVSDAALEKLMLKVNDLVIDMKQIQHDYEEKIRSQAKNVLNCVKRGHNRAVKLATSAVKKMQGLFMSLDNNDELEVPLISQQELFNPFIDPNQTNLDNTISFSTLGRKHLERKVLGKSYEITPDETAKALNVSEEQIQNSLGSKLAANDNVINFQKMQEALGKEMSDLNSQTEENAVMSR